MRAELQSGNYESTRGRSTLSSIGAEYVGEAETDLINVVQMFPAGEGEIVRPVSWLSFVCPSKRRT